ncbi:hypothetical protein EDB84DRAFT_56138 [Lactarius hengduanensis]|nr:hypothetical protein EDB84DRAFT_56138 [Lactarius hengduanensis]
MSQPSKELLVDGYMSRAFSPKRAEEYLSHLLKMKNWKALDLTLPSPSGPSVVFVVQEAPRLLQTPPFIRDCNVPLWLLDYDIKDIGTVVPQTLWTPLHRADFRQHVEDADLQLPIFFIHGNGILGLSLEDAANGRCHNLRDANAHAQLGGKTTTHIRISWPGYQDFKRQVQIRDETTAHNPITVARFAQHVGRSVDAFLSSISRENLKSSNLRWEIGNNEINRANIRVIGAVHVSAGSWMPILQLNFYVI